MCCLRNQVISPFSEEITRLPYKSYSSYHSFFSLGSTLWPKHSFLFQVHGPCKKGSGRNTRGTLPLAITPRALPGPCSIYHTTNPGSPAEYPGISIHPGLLTRVSANLRRSPSWSRTDTLSHETPVSVSPDSLNAIKETLHWLIKVYAHFLFFEKIPKKYFLSISLTHISHGWIRFSPRPLRNIS